MAKHYQPSLRLMKSLHEEVDCKFDNVTPWEWNNGSVLEHVVKMEYLICEDKYTNRNLV